jgi:hypothetical protein
MIFTCLRYTQRRGEGSQSPVGEIRGGSRGEEFLEGEGRRCFKKIIINVYLVSHWSFFSRLNSWPAFGKILRIKVGFRNNF